MRRSGLRLSALLIVLAGSAAVPVAVPHAAAANTLPTNPLAFAYTSPPADVSDYAHPAGMVVTGRCNRYDQAFKNARDNGAEVLAYLNVAERGDSRVCAADEEFYGGPFGTTPLWPYPTPGARKNFQGSNYVTYLTDMRVGSTWVDQAVNYIADLMTEDKVDGVFLDVVGSRLWSGLSDWKNWPQIEKDRWTDGNVDLVRKLDAKRRAINPRFIIVNNNLWDHSTTNPRGLAAEQYVDGICLEHNLFDAEHFRLAGKAYGNLGHRRVIAVGRTQQEAVNWAGVQGVTNVSSQSDYGEVPAPPVGFHRLTDRPKTFGRTSVAANPSGGMTANQKRGSKFTLTDKATLFRLFAYLDGLGPTTEGSQGVRMVLYRDNGGVPGARLAQSPTATINAGLTGRWVAFNLPPIALDPGTYWIVIHTDATGGIARNRGDGAANWYGNADTFSDGASDPFGGGSAGAVTLSVYASYTVGH
jgi:hypothetical protein